LLSHTFIYIYLSIHPFLSVVLQIHLSTSSHYLSLSSHLSFLHNYQESLPAVISTFLWLFDETNTFSSREVRCNPRLFVFLKY
jgi:hypothetical protein